MKHIHEILRVSQEEYEVNYVFDLWFNWCMSKAISETEFQILLHDRAISRWFMEELKWKELEFRQDIKPFENTSNALAIQAHYRKMCQVINWPDTLVKRTRKEVKGIKIPMLNYAKNNPN